MKITIFAVVALLLASSAEARPRKHWYTDPKWWAGEAVIAAAIAADAHSTATRPSYAMEKNPLLGPDPSTGKVAGISLTNFAVQTACHATAWHLTHHVPLADGSGYAEDRLGWRIFGATAIPAEVAIISGHNAAKNYRLR